MHLRKCDHCSVCVDCGTDAATQDSDGNSALIACVQGEAHALLTRAVLQVPLPHLSSHFPIQNPQAMDTTKANPTSCSRCLTAIP
jgi:hypothetical protein